MRSSISPARTSFVSGCLAACLAFAAGCAQLGLAPNEVDETAVREEPGRREPAHVVVQHVLIAHEGAEIPGVTRTLPEAERLANTVLEKARGGARFDDLVRLYSDDRGDGGVYAIANFGARREAPNEVERVGLARAFGDAAFSMEVGEFALVPYDKKRSPYGFHILQRLK